MKILFLDDDLERHKVFMPNTNGHQVTQVYGVEDAIAALDKERFDVVYLDHDLGGRQMVEEREGTGTIVAEFIASMPEEDRPKTVIIHSYNPDGAYRMHAICQAAGLRRTIRMPFGCNDFYGPLQQPLTAV